MKPTAIALIWAYLLCGCAGAPVGWGGTDEVLFSTAETIRLQWDSRTTTEDSVRRKAVAHCGGRNVEVMDTGFDASTSGVMRSKTWQCGDGNSRATTTPLKPLR